MKAVGLALLVGLSTAYAQASDCRKEAEKIAIDDAKKEDKTMNAAKETSRITDAETLKVSKVKADELLFSTQAHNPKGDLIPYSVVVKKKGCKKVSVEATEL